MTATGDTLGPSLLWLLLLAICPRVLSVVQTYCSKAGTHLHPVMPFRGPRPATVTLHPDLFKPSTFEARLHTHLHYKVGACFPAVARAPCSQNLPGC